MKLFISLFVIVAVLGVAGSITHHTIKVKAVHKNNTIKDSDRPTQCW